MCVYGRAQKPPGSVWGAPEGTVGETQMKRGAGGASETYLIRTHAGFGRQDLISETCHVVDAGWEVPGTCCCSQGKQHSETEGFASSCSGRTRTESLTSGWPPRPELLLKRKRNITRSPILTLPSSVYSKGTNPHVRKAILSTVCTSANDLPRPGPHLGKAG